MKWFAIMFLWLLAFVALAMISKLAFLIAIGVCAGVALAVGIGWLVKAMIKAHKKQAAQDAIDSDLTIDSPNNSPKVILEALTTKKEKELEKSPFLSNPFITSQISAFHLLSDFGNFVMGFFRSSPQPDQAARQEIIAEATADKIQPKL